MARDLPSQVDDLTERIDALSRAHGDLKRRVAAIEAPARAERASTNKNTAARARPILTSPE